MIFLNKKFLIISVCSAILVAVLAYFCVYFLYKTIENNSKELARLEKEVVLTGNKLEDEKKDSRSWKIFIKNSMAGGKQYFYCRTFCFFYCFYCKRVFIL